MQILIVEDEVALAGELQALFFQQHYDTQWVAHGQLALDILVAQVFDLVLLDIMLPGLDGLEILRLMREAHILTPVLILTARDAVSDRIQGLDRGADDYLSKPFSSDELLARVRALLRRGQSHGSPLLIAGALKLDTVRREAWLEQVKLTLTPIEFRIVEFLMYSKNRAVSRFNLAEHVWGHDFDPFTMSNGLEVHIKNLRRKLGDYADLLVTVRGTGYMITESSVS